MDNINEEEANTKVSKLEDLMIEILSRLPVKTLLNFRCICKTWFRLISDKYFANLHLSRSPPGILIKASPDGGMSSTLHLIEIVETGETFKVERMKFVPETNLPATLDFELMNSCNGLLCLSEGESHNVIHVCNLVLGQHITIPVDNDNDKAFAHGKFFYLGFSQATDQYKVIRTFYSKVKSDQKSNCKAEIYTIGSTREWRSVRNAFSMGRLDFNTCVDGRIHWVLHDKRPWRRICSFDFESEEFKKLTLPFKFDGKTCQLKLGVSKGCLCVTVERLGPGVQFDVWVMKEYGVKKSWIKQYYVMENLYPDDHHLDYYEPLIILSNGNILISVNEKLIVCYNTKTKRLDEEITVYQTQGFIDAIAYTPSFVSLNDIAKGEQVKALRTNKLRLEIAKFLKRGSEDKTKKSD